MKKFLFIILLTFSLGACATHEPGPTSASSLLTFEQIGAEITVGYEEIDSVEEIDDTVVMSFTGTPR